MRSASPYVARARRKEIRIKSLITLDSRVQEQENTRGEQAARQRSSASAGGEARVSQSLPSHRFMLCSRQGVASADTAPARISAGDPLRWFASSMSNAGGCPRADRRQPIGTRPTQLKSERMDTPRNFQAGAFAGTAKHTFAIGLLIPRHFWRTLSPKRSYRRRLFFLTWPAGRDA